MTTATSRSYSSSYSEEEDYLPKQCILKSQSPGQLSSREWREEIRKIHSKIDIVFSKDKDMEIGGLPDSQIFDISLKLAEFRASLKSLLIDEKMIEVVKSIILMQESRGK